MKGSVIKKQLYIHLTPETVGDVGNSISLSTCGRITRLKLAWQNHTEHVYV